MVEKAKNGERLREPDYCPSKFYSLVMMRCWAENPDERLNFEEAKSCLVSVSLSIITYTDKDKEIFELAPAST